MVRAVLGIYCMWNPEYIYIYKSSGQYLNIHWKTWFNTLRVGHPACFYSTQFPANKQRVCKLSDIIFSAIPSKKFRKFRYFVVDVIMIDKPSLL